jgi:hypothetical protein
MQKHYTTSSYSFPDPKFCVEVARTDEGIVCVRDSKNRHGGELSVVNRQWASFMARIQKGVFDH